jgi:hypothetical protein
MMDHSHSLSLDSILLSATKDYLANSADTQRTFAEKRLLPQIQAHGVPGPRPPGDSTTVDEYTARINNMQNTYSRIMNGTSLIPLAWLWPWVYALPISYRSRVVNQIRAQLPDTVPSLATGASTHANIGRLATEAGEAITSLAGIAADGVYNDEDDPKEVKAALNELYDLRDQAQAEAEALESGTGLNVSRTNR